MNATLRLILLELLVSYSGGQVRSFVQSSDLIRRAIGDHSDQIGRSDDWTNDWKFPPLVSYNHEIKVKIIMYSTKKKKKKKKTFDRSTDHFALCKAFWCLIGMSQTYQDRGDNGDKIWI